MVDGKVAAPQDGRRVAELYCIVPECRAAIPDHVDRCVGCGADVGSPNVRAASGGEEVNALRSRYLAVRKEGAARGTDEVLGRLEKVLERSVAVICRPWGILNTLVVRENRLHATYHQEVQAHGRLPERNEFDRRRPGIDATFFPYYHERMQFAALSIDGRGSLAYGGGCMALKDGSVTRRSTVFEENTLVFVRKHRHQAGEPPPPGCTATWATRAQLGIAKLAGRVRPDMREDELAPLVLEQRGRTDQDDFLEVHIYGDIHGSSVASISGKMPTEKAERAVAKMLVDDLKKAGAKVKIIP